jgi:cysteine desulfurase/selenocysteine lyase
MTALAVPAQARPRTSTGGLDVARVRKDFPILATTVHGHPLVYLDNGATTQKPRAVIDAICGYYERENANIHRGVYQLSRESTSAYEEARKRVAKFIHAAEPKECIFTRGTTESINLVASSWGRTFLKPGDEILLTAMEHHSNIVPWQICCEQTGAKLKVIPVNDRGELQVDQCKKLLEPRTKLVAVTHVSNVLGTINDVKLLAKLAHQAGALILVDGAQWVAHHPTDVQDLDVDFYAFSGHKMYGPTGIGILYGKHEWLERMPPYQGGGDMISSVSFEKTTYAELPNKFEAGTPNIAGVVGLRAAVDYLLGLGFDKVAAHEDELARHAGERLAEVPGLRLVGTAKPKLGVFSFLMEHPCIAPLDVGAALDLDGIAVRTGHHCCQPLMDRLHITGTARVSLALYNTQEEIDRCVESLCRLRAKKVADTPKCADRIELDARTEPKYPPAYGPSPEAAAQKLIDAFEFLPDWTQRYEYIIDLGKKLLPLPAEEKTEGNRIQGCQSRVWLSARKRPGTPDVMDFLAESDADIVSGLIALLQKVYSGQRAQAILDFDVKDFFTKLGIEDHLAMTRRNGLGEMVKRIRQLASAMVHASESCTIPDCSQCRAVV